MNTNKLEVVNLKKRFPNGDGIEDINLYVKTGELVTLLGPSGCGKTTILRAVGGFAPIDKGSILLDGQDITKLPPEKRPTAMVFQSYNLWPHMTIYDNLAFGLKLRKASRTEIRRLVDIHLDMVKMPGCEKKYPSQLSGGQQQRVAIARALMLKPSLLLLDEPFSALDAKIRTEMRAELKKLQQQLGITVMFVTHDQEEAMSISDRIIVMNKGGIEQIGSPVEIYDQPKSKYVAAFIGDMNFFEADGVIKAIRPEDITVDRTGGKGDIRGTVSLIMVLGHYVAVSVQLRDGQTIKVFLVRAQADGLRLNDEVGLTFTRQMTYAS